MEKLTQPPGRLTSLDTFRGITMFLLIAEAARVYDSLGHGTSDGTFFGAIITQFHHHPWNGLRFWDLIQPFFMFIVGVAMPFSYQSRIKKGQTHTQITRHILQRCLLLFLFGTGLHCVYNQKLVWELWNVLTQLSFTILVAYVIMRMSLRNQLIISLVLLVIAEVAYRLYEPGSPFVKDQNFGSFMDMILMGKINNGGGWVTVNCVSTAAHTIWGVLCGKVLLSEKTPDEKIKLFAIAGSIALILGYGLDWTGITPIVKRIATTSFVFASGGWALLALALAYWFVDIKGHKKWAFPFIIVGMNPIFIYLFSETIGKQWWPMFIGIWNDGILGAMGVSEPVLDVTRALLVLASFWGLCYFLYKKGIFFRI